ncbi:hypothetical protein DAPPUDRAFT_105704 [Daphnia pulex]|uniref:Uncharacterized protein n=1 Tax=Daphnia pulex TaxID=6669 RepID=E9GRJ3_DAPPU|nr:hypothetical protein DAPPUDRAFT_105704 [Daphnia pulex]|eukprot:EFX77784.1 hypothetical protein DAPPUDRAFT_105704 [Daphnia pulex]
MRDNALLKNFCNNIERTWITSTVWPPKSWSMFNQHRRTNNNAEGYHNHLKLEIASNSPNFMKFILKLKEEADKIYLKAKLLSQEQALQRESSDTANMQHHLTAAWEKYNDKKISSTELLQILGKLNRKHSQKEQHSSSIPESILLGPEVNLTFRPRA